MGGEDHSQAGCFPKLEAVVSKRGAKLLPVSCIKMDDAKTFRAKVVACFLPIILVGCLNPVHGVGQVVPMYVHQYAYTGFRYGDGFDLGADPTARPDAAEMDDYDDYKDVTGICASMHSFVTVHADGQVKNWGTPFSDGYAGTGPFQHPIDSQTRADIKGRVQDLKCSNRACAVILDDRTIRTWGDENHLYYLDQHGTDVYSSVRPELYNITKIYASDMIHAALRDDGKLFVWGMYRRFGTEQVLVTPGLASENVVDAYAYNGINGIRLDEDYYQDNDYGPWGDDIMILRQDGSMMSVRKPAGQITGGTGCAWNNVPYGPCSNFNPDLSAGFTMESFGVSNGRAAMAVREDGTVVSFGETSYGSFTDGVFQGDHALGSTPHDVKQIVPRVQGFTALLAEDNGKIYCFPASQDERDCLGPYKDIGADNVEKIWGGFAITAFRKTDGSFYSYGSWHGGGSGVPPAEYKPFFEAGNPIVVDVVFSRTSVLALREDGMALCWGHYYGGLYANGGVHTRRQKIVDLISANVSKIFSYYKGFGVIKTDGSVVAWAEEANAYYPFEELTTYNLFTAAKKQEITAIMEQKNFTNIITNSYNMVAIRGEVEDLCPIRRGGYQGAFLPSPSPTNSASASAAASFTPSASTSASWTPSASPSAPSSPSAPASSAGSSSGSSGNNSIVIASIAGAAGALLAGWALWHWGILGSCCALCRCCFAKLERDEKDDLVVYVVDENTHCRITTSQALLQMGLRRSAAINGKWTSSDVMAPTMLAGSHDDGTNVAVRVGRIVGRSKSGSVILHRYLIQDDAETDGDKCIREEIDVDKEPCLAPAWWHMDNKSKGTTTQSKTKASAARPRHFDISFKFVSSALYEAWLDHLPSESQVFSKPFALDGKGRLPH